MRLPALALLLPLFLPLPALAEVPLVVTDIPPVHALVAQVLGDLGNPVLLLERGADEHDFQLRPSQMHSIAQAGLIVWIGPELTPWLDRASASSRAPKLGLLAAPGTTTQAYPRVATDDHDPSGIDPHAWLNPANAAVWLRLIAAELSRTDPANAAIYAANANGAAKEIAALDAEISAALVPVATFPFVTHHNAFGYFAAHYRLSFAGSLADGEAADPGAAHLVDLRNLLEDQTIRCVFPEAAHDPARAAQLVEGTNVRLGGALDPVGAALTPGPEDYGALLRGIAQTLVACLQG